MPFHQRINDGNLPPDKEVQFWHDWVFIRFKGGWRIYEDASYYSQITGQVLMKGKMVRRYDPDVQGTKKEGKPAEFTTVNDAIAYLKRWNV